TPPRASRCWRDCRDQELLTGCVDVELDRQTRGLASDPVQILRMGLLTAADEMKLPAGESLRDQGAKRADHLELLLGMAAVLIEEASHRQDQRLFRSTVRRERHRRMDHVTLAPPAAPYPPACEFRDGYDLLVRGGIVGGKLRVAQEPVAAEEPRPRSLAHLDRGERDADLARVTTGTVVIRCERVASNDEADRLIPSSPDHIHIELDRPKVRAHRCAPAHASVDFNPNVRRRRRGRTV